MIIASLAFGAPYVVIVALKPIGVDFGGYRSVPSAAASLAMLGTGVGGLLMSWLAERWRKGASWYARDSCYRRAHQMGGPGCFTWDTVCSLGWSVTQLSKAPLNVYVTRWFDRRRRGTALALITSGQYVAGACWPPLFQRAIGPYFHLA